MKQNSPAELARRALVASPFLGLALLCFRIIDIDKLAAQQIPFLEAGLIEWDGGSIPILDRFHPPPLEFLDDVWRGATATFSPSTLAYDGVAWWQMFTQLNDTGPLVAVWVIESCRAGNAYTLIYFPFLFIMASQLLGAGPVAPLYYFAHLLSAAPVEQLARSESARSIRSKYLTAFLPLLWLFYNAVIFGMYTPGDLGSRHYWTWAWQMTPLWLSMANFATAHLLLPLLPLLPRPAGQKERPGGGAVSPTAVSTLVGAGLVSGGAWIYMLVACPYSLAEVFLPQASGGGTESAFVDHTRLVLQTDELFTFGSSWLWITYSFFGLRSLNLITSLDWVFIFAALPVIGLCAGPGLAFAVGWYWRERKVSACSM